MTCPHCLVAIHRNSTSTNFFSADVEEGGDRYRYRWNAEHQTCPACSRLIVWLVYLKLGFQSSGLYEIDKKEMIVIPKAAARKPLPPEIPQQYSDDYKEACLVLGDSPKASAALSRRCLQNLIHDVSNIRLRNLNDEIEALITKGALPSFINEQLHAVRVIGNFAAHPLKSTSSGEIIDVEPGEAEWTLDVLDSLFDFYFIQPAVAQKRKEQINQKLSSAGKPTI